MSSRNGHRYLALSRKSHRYEASQAIEPIVYSAWPTTNICNGYWLIYPLFLIQSFNYPKQELPIYSKFPGDPMLGVDAIFCSHKVSSSSPSGIFWDGVPRSALLWWPSISQVEQQLGEPPPYVPSKVICRSLTVFSRICSVFCRMEINLRCHWFSSRTLWMFNALDWSPPPGATERNNVSLTNFWFAMRDSSSSTFCLESIRSRCSIRWFSVKCVSVGSRCSLVCSDSLIMDSSQAQWSRTCWFAACSSRILDSNCPWYCRDPFSRSKILFVKLQIAWNSSVGGGIFTNQNLDHILKGLVLTWKVAIVRLRYWQVLFGTVFQSNLCKGKCWLSLYR